MTAGPDRRTPDPGPPTRRGLLDHALRRRALLLGLRQGRVSRAEACDASPYLRAAAVADGRPAGRACPVCDGASLVVVTWVYGRRAGLTQGRSVIAAELADLLAEGRELAVHEVEVCPPCGWNHLTVSYTLSGTRGPGPTGPAPSGTMSR